MIIRLIDFRILAIIVIVFCIASCENNPVTPPNNTPQTIIKGKINNWKSGDTLYFVASVNPGALPEQLTTSMVGYSKVANTGDFSLNLSVPQPQFLERSSNFTSSDSAALFAWCEFTIRGSQAYTLQYIYNGNVSLSKLDSDSAKVGDYQVSYKYADREVHLTASDDFWSTNSLHYFSEYDEHLQKGWNKIVTTIVARKGNEVYKQTVVKSINEENWYLW